MDPILIAGGGIGGLGAALALSRAGHPVRLFERAAEFREAGAGIQLGPNVFHMLDRLGVREAVERDAVRPDALVMRCAVHGHEITRVPLDGMPARFGNPYAVTHRADLHRSLLEACQSRPDILLETARSVAVFIEDAQGVTVRLEDGDCIRGSALVGADGLWSRTRQVVVGDGRPVVSGHIAYRAVVPMDSLPEAVRENRVTLWAGPRLHLVHYPLRRGEVMNLVAVFHSDHYAEGWDQAGDPKLLWRHFDATRPEVRDLLSRIETWRYWVLCDREPRRGWTRGRVTLLGDAAHPMLQYLAQGANMALEDAVCLADQLRVHAGDVAAAFAAYEALRVLRTGRVQTMARVFGEIYHAGGVRAELRDAWLAGRDPEAAREGMAWLYDRPRWPGDAG
ncbi:3-hydroxybenzoate 6-monooxygenase [Paracraurococcus ruber]|uniref:Salicylate hydroxylase n=1 Tax=Paracraurococcus ruber TaxID=77675 RepID=A0ABS1CXQ2_9PROT|nr:3-hydroxybenzoate 6-monooxygenase [Paracraurococcus ruber]MBK1658807.1 salicylate hydroxylase [Paracraurococcus ruber]TDG33210.1 3-hydroxybenzoate 6-monooxygenase [Paracraurococcus ruber]